MASIIIELSTDDPKDLEILRVVTEATGAPVNTKETLPPAKILPFVPTGSKIADELKQELQEIDNESAPEPTLSDIFNAPAPPAGAPLPPAPLAPAPPAGAPPAPPAPPAVDLDSDNLPWDARIHSGKKTKIVSGQWKRLRGVSADTLSIVTEELKNLMTTAPPATPPAPPATPPATPPAIPPVLPVSAPTTFEDFVVAMVKVGKTNADVDPLLAKRGIKALNLLGARPDLIPEIWAELTA